MTIKDSKPLNVGFICFSAAFGGLLFGFDTAVISGAVEPITIQFSLSTAAEGWFVSSGLLGCILGVLVAGIFTDRVGRKPILLLSGLLFFISAIGCSSSLSEAQLIIYRLIGGIGVGVASVVSPMYITEFAPAKSRGRMVAIYQLSITFGILLAYFSNAYLLYNSSYVTTTAYLPALFFKTEVWRAMFLVMAVPALVFIAMILFVPESARWLINKGKLEQAQAVLQRLQSQKIKEMITDTKESKQNKKDIRSPLKSKRMRYLLLIGVLLCIFQQFSGINAIIYYGPKIFSLAGLSGDNALQAQIIIGLVNVLFTCIAIMQSDKFGRKALLMLGLSGMIISLSIVGFCFYTNFNDGILLLIMLVLFIGCFALSVGPVTWILINEIFPNEVRAKAVSICTFILWITVWVVGQFFPWLLKVIGPAGVFWVFAFFSLINLLFCRQALVETKGKTLEEIERIFIGGH